MGKNLDSQQCLNHGEDNPLGRPLDLIINKCSVLRDEKDTSLNFTALSARRREITGTRETPKHVKRACMRPSAGVGDEVFPCVFTMNGGEQPAKQLEGEKLQQNYAYPQPLLHKTSLYSRQQSKQQNGDNPFPPPPEHVFIVWCATSRMWKLGVGLFFYHVSPRDETQVSFGSLYICSLSHLAGPVFVFEDSLFTQDGLLLTPILLPLLPKCCDNRHRAGTSGYRQFSTVKI